MEQCRYCECPGDDHHSACPSLHFPSLRETPLMDPKQEMRVALDIAVSRLRHASDRRDVAETHAQWTATDHEMRMWQERVDDLCAWLADDDHCRRLQEHVDGLRIQMDEEYNR